MIIITASFTAELLKPYLNYFLKKINLSEEIVFAPYKQIFQQLLDPNNLLKKNQQGINILLIRIEDFLQTEGNLLNLELAFKHINDLITAIKSFSIESKIPLLFCLCPPSELLLKKERFLELHKKCEDLLQQELSVTNIYCISKNEISSLYPVAEYDDFYAYEIGHIPYTQEFFCALGITLVRKINAIHQPPYKVIVLDCDNTLWEGVCGEIGYQEIKIGKPQLELQQMMLEQYKKGILLCLCSKNNAEDVVSVFANRKDMLLKLEHFVSKRINWRAKSENIKHLSKELKLGLDSFIFIDDNPIECADIQTSYPEVLCLTLPENHFKISEFLQHVWALDHVNITLEDKNRSKLYQQNIEREKLKKSIFSLSDFIASLQLNIEVYPIKKEDYSRVAQLTQRTNQFNCTTIRYSERQLEDLLQNSIECLTVRVSDRFGDYGLVGALFYRFSNASLEVLNLLLSCRVLGKGVEHKIIAELGKIGLNNNIENIRLKFISSGKNNPALQFLNNLENFTTVALGSELLFETTTNNACNIEYHPDVISNVKKTDLSKSPILFIRQNHNQQIIDIANNYRTIPEIFSKVYTRKPISSETYASNKVPENTLENELIRLWEDILKIEPISSDDNFFDLGGDSFLATLIVSRIWQQFDIKLTIVDFLCHPTVSQLAQALSKHKLSLLKQTITPLSPDLRYQPLPVSYAQERLWFLQQMDISSPQYNMFIAIKLKGKLNLAVLEQAFFKLIERHESFRTYFIEEKGIPKQIVNPIDEIKLPLINIINVEKCEDLYYLARKEAQKSFDLSKAPLIRITLIPISENEHILLLNQHHIISDGWSYSIFCKELNYLYSTLYKKEEHSLPPQTINYLDFAIWQKEWLEEEVLKRQLDYWKNHLTDLPNLNLPIKHGELNSYQGKRIAFSIDSEIAVKLNHLSRTTNTTLYVILLAAFSVLLARYSTQEEIAIGSPIAGRHYPGVENVIGFFVNLIVLRLNLKGNPSFVNLLQHTKITVEEAYLNQDAPFDKVVEVLQPERKLGTNPLVQVMFAFQNFMPTHFELSELEVERVFSDNESLLLADFDTAKFNLSFYLQESENKLQGLIEYNTGLFGEDLIQQMTVHFKTILIDIANQPERPIFYLPLFSNDELKFFNNCNNTQTIYSNTKLVHQLFEEQVEKTPTNIAVSFKDRSVTYKKLNEEANQLAHYLAKQGVGEGSKVVVYIEQNLFLAVSILAIFKVGGIYVPIAHNTPVERLKEICLDSQPFMVLSEKEISSQLKESILPIIHTKIIALDVIEPLLKLEDHSNLNAKLNSDHTAYLIYTSGSTGKPKGILLPHRTINNLITWQSKIEEFKAPTKISQYAAFGFDVSIQEIFLALLNGHELCIIPPKIRSSIKDLITFINNKNINILFLPTAVLDPFTNAVLKYDFSLDFLNKIIVSGEKLKITESIKQFFIKHVNIKLVNQYGPSETHVVTAYDLEQDANQWDTFPSIGKPISNTAVYILDKYLSLVPSGVIGEIYIAGEGLAKGYLNQPDITIKKFVKNPFDNEGLLFKTGDLGRWLSNGIIDYVERIDDQIKIRGFRVELGEIEARLLEHPKINQAVITVLRNQQLTAHLILKTSKDIICKQELLDFLKMYLPHYMIPYNYIVHNSFPLTQNGKIDKNALMRINSENSLISTYHNNPSTPTQQTLAKIFAELLDMQVDNINIHDSFFLMGGHSLLILQLISLVEKQLKVKIFIQNVFDNPSIEELSALIDRKSKSKLSLQVSLNDFTSSPLLLNTESNHPRLYLIHPLSGTTFSYVALAKALVYDVTCYGIQHPHIENEPLDFNDISSMANYYVDLILKFDPSGSYSLAGHSFGGLVAMEMAKQLMEKGLHVEKICLLDTWVLSSRLNGQQAYKDKYLSVPWEKTIAKPIKEKLNIDLHELSQNLHKLAIKFEPPILDKKITLLKAEQAEFGKDDKNYLTPYSIYPIDVQYVSGDHETMLEEPNVHILAKKLKTLFNKELLSI